MPKCLECGFVATRLQWTHFKYNCSGKFANGREYQAAYPRAELVDDELKKKACVTLNGLMRKYGTEEGQIRWENYKAKQAFTNSFEYKQQKYGWSEEDFEAYNKSRASTLENMIAKYGEEKGSVKWQLYCERQSYTNTLDYFVEKYGEEKGFSKYSEINLLKAHTIENVQRVHNCSMDDAKRILESRNLSVAFTSNLEKIIISEIEQRLRRKLQFTINTKQYCVWGNDKPNFYDIVDNNRAIEINGDYWHCNPNRYDPNYYHPTSQLLAEEIWIKDRQKIDLLLELRNIPTLVVWESEYIDNKKEVINKCIQWLQVEK
jgi:hypothetical protein